MKNLILGVCLTLTSLVFGQSDDDTLFYDMYWVKTDTLPDKTFKISRNIEGDPTPEFFIKEQIIGEQIRIQQFQKSIPRVL